MAEYVDGDKKKEILSDEDKLKTCRKWAEGESNSRLKQEALWYEIQLYKDGNHYNIIPTRDRATSSSIKVIPITRKKGEIQRAFNKFRAMLRSLKAAATSTEIRYEVPGGSESEIIGSNYLNWYSARYDMNETISDVADYGFTRSVGYFDVYWDSLKAMPIVEARDPFDLLMDRYGKYARRTYLMRKDDFKETRDSEGKLMFEVKKDDTIPTTKKMSSSEIWDNYLTSKYKQRGSDELDDVMVEEFHKLEQNDDGSFQVRIITTVQEAQKIFKEEVYKDDELRFIPYWPERRPGDIYNEPWMKDLLDPQKSLDNMYTHFEEFIRTMGKGRYLVRKDQTLDHITDKDGQRVEYEGEKPDQLEMGHIGSDQFNFDQKVELMMEDVGGLHPSQTRKTETARGIAYLIAQDETNTTEPSRNLKKSLIKVGKRLLKLANRHMMTTQDIFWWQDGQRTQGSVVSPNSPILQGGNPPNGVSLIDNVDYLAVELIPKGAFAALAREEKAIQLATQGLIQSPEVAMEMMNIGNVREYVEKEKAFRAEQAQQEMQKEQMKAQMNQNQQNQEENDNIQNQEVLRNTISDLKRDIGVA